MSPQIRDYLASDLKPVVALSLRAWSPVFASFEELLGAEIFRRLHPDWRNDQDKAVLAVLADPAMQLSVPETMHRPVGFVAGEARQ
jgi:hypothetical protein